MKKNPKSICAFATVLLILMASCSSIHAPGSNSSEPNLDMPSGTSDISSQPIPSFDASELEDEPAADELRISDGSAIF